MFMDGAAAKYYRQRIAAAALEEAEFMKLMIRLSLGI